MSRTASTPGPLPTACLTCRQRRKKCDSTKPRCESCLKGGYECLGYDTNKHRMRGIRKKPTVPKPSRLQRISPSDPPPAARSETLDPVVLGSSENWEDLADTNTGNCPRPSILGAALQYRISEHFSSANNDCASTDSSGEFNYSWPQDQSQRIVYSRSPMLQASCVARFSNVISSTRLTNEDLDRGIETLCQSIPPEVDATRMKRENYFVHIINQYLLQRVSCWFTAPPPIVHDIFAARVKQSKRMTWTLYLGARLFQALSEDSCGKIAQRYIGWIDKLDEKFNTESSSNTLVGDMADRFMVQLELAFFKFTVVDNYSGYTLLQKALPKFLQLVAADPNLFMERSNGDLVVSFPRALTAPRYEFGRFVTYDTVAALVLGVTPLVEYGYGEEYNSAPYGLEWIHGIPVVLFEAISQVNSWRAGSRVPLDDWQALEKRVLAWQPPSALPDEVSTIVSPSVARVAVQEGWRHVVLIYIYMGICCVSSDDPRVQSSVHRIVQLGEMVANLPICVQTLTHCIVAGLGARLEKHRILVRNMLLSFKDTRVWLLQGPQFSQVLCHLWRGVGAGGAPIKWDDYVRSRCAVIPI